jgi:hypothetical protein
MLLETRSPAVVDERAAALAQLERAGLPVAPMSIVWLGGPPNEAVRALDDRPLMVKAPRDAGGAVWATVPGDLVTLAPTLPTGRYLVMERVPDAGGHLKVFVVGDRVGAVRRPFPALSARERRGTPVLVPAPAADLARETARELALDELAVDLVDVAGGFVIVDVHVGGRTPAYA